MAPCPTAGIIWFRPRASNSNPSQERMPNRVNPAWARIVASANPRTIAFSRVSTLPRISQSLTSGKNRLAWARRRGLPVASFSIRSISLRLINTSAADSRGRYPAMANPGCILVGKSFALCTARSARPSIRAISNSLVNRPFPPFSCNDQAWRLSPVVVNRNRRTSTSGSLSRNAAATKSVWAKANGLLRVANVMRAFTDLIWKGLSQRSLRKGTKAQRHKGTKGERRPRARRGERGQVEESLME